MRPTVPRARHQPEELQGTLTQDLGPEKLGPARGTAPLASSLLREQGFFLQFMLTDTWM